MSDNQKFVYDEDEAAAFIIGKLPAELSEKFSVEDIGYVLELMSEYYENIGLITDEDAVVNETDAPIEVDTDELYEFIMDAIEEDEMKQFSGDDIEVILDAEYEYCVSKGIIDETEEA